MSIFTVETLDLNSLFELFKDYSKFVCCFDGILFSQELRATMIKKGHEMDILALSQIPLKENHIKLDVESKTFNDSTFLELNGVNRIETVNEKINKLFLEKYNYATN